MFLGPAGLPTSLPSFFPSAVYESVLVIDNEGLVHKVNELKFMAIAGCLLDVATYVRACILSSLEG